MTLLLVGQQGKPNQRCTAEPRRLKTWACRASDWVKLLDDRRRSSTGELQQELNVWNGKESDAPYVRTEKPNNPHENLDT